MARRFVIYRDKYNWNGAAEFETGWLFKKVQHAPITHADTPEEVFAWLFKRYPNSTISCDPSVSRRYAQV